MYPLIGPFKSEYIVTDIEKGKIISPLRIMTKSAELKGKIRVNVISPGTIDTAIFDAAPQEMKDEFVSIIPMGRIGEPREIATAALFLASEDSSFVTGIEPFVDGGTTQV